MPRFQKLMIALVICLTPSLGFSYAPPGIDEAFTQLAAIGVGADSVAACEAAANVADLADSDLTATDWANVDACNAAWSIAENESALFQVAQIGLPTVDGGNLICDMSACLAGAAMMSCTDTSTGVTYFANCGNSVPNIEGDVVPDLRRGTRVLPGDRRQCSEAFPCPNVDPAPRIRQQPLMPRGFDGVPNFQGGMPGIGG